MAVNFSCSFAGPYLFWVALVAFLPVPFFLKPKSDFWRKADFPRQRNETITEKNDANKKMDREKSGVEPVTF